MTDEMQYVKLAISVAETHSPLPRLHGTSVPVANQLYPLLLAPFYGWLPSPDAFRAAHLLNAVVMTSATVPAYLLARQLLGRLPSLAVAVLTVVTPWMVLTGFLMSEAVAYPAFLWAMLALHRTIVEPSPRRDLIAAAALGVAILARTQFLSLALVLPAAVLVHEAASGVAARGGGAVAASLRSAARSAVVRHRVLWVVYTIGAAVAALAALAGHRVLGAYSTTVESGSLLPAAVWGSALEHLDLVGMGCGLVPLVLGGGWILTAVVRPEARERHAFATLSLLTLGVLAVQTASFVLRFGGADAVRDR
jgi:hypothetical protein